MEVSIFDQVHDIMTGRRQKAVAENEADTRGERKTSADKRSQ